ncbi:hypothetical protein OIU78_004954, partial [Salix suchowensis]
MPLSKAKLSPIPLTTMDSEECLGTSFSVCRNVIFSSSPVSAVATANPYVKRPRNTCHGNTLILTARASPRCQKLMKPIIH